MLSGLITIKDIQKKSIQYPNSAKDHTGRLLAELQLSNWRYDERVAALVKSKVDVIVVDTAHGHSYTKECRSCRQR